MFDFWAWPLTMQWAPRLTQVIECNSHIQIQKRCCGWPEPSNRPERVPKKSGPDRQTWGRQVLTHYVICYCMTRARLIIATSATMTTHRLLRSGVSITPSPSSRPITIDRYRFDTCLSQKLQLRLANAPRVLALHRMPPVGTSNRWTCEHAET